MRYVILVMGLVASAAASITYPRAAVPSNQPVNDVVAYLKAYIYEDVQVKDGVKFTSPIFAEDSANGLKNIAFVNDELRQIVKRVLRNDYNSHRTEYAARKQIALAETISKPLNVEVIQNRVWSIFLEDPRWVLRVIPQILEEAKSTGVTAHSSIPLPVSAPLQTTDEKVRSLYSLLVAYRSPEGASTCAQNPTLAFRTAKGQDPLLASRIYSLTVEAGTPLDVDEVIRRLSNEGWRISRGGN